MLSFALSDARPLAQFAPPFFHLFLNASHDGLSRLLGSRGAVALGQPLQRTKVLFAEMDVCSLHWRFRDLRRAIFFRSIIICASPESAGLSTDAFFISRQG